MLAHLDVAPDDVWVGPEGSVWLTATDNSAVLKLGSQGQAQSRFLDANAPEGIVVTSSETLVAEQTRNRIVTLDSTGASTPFLDLPNRTTNPGVDGLGLDAVHQLLLIPDSPNGALLSVPLGGGSPRTLATNLGRPVAATVGADGAIYVASEDSPGLFRVPPAGGRATPVGSLPALDEVLTVNGLLYVASLGDGTVRAVDPSTGTDHTLVTGGHQPQGLTKLPDGRLLLADSPTRTLAIVDPC